MNTRISHAQRIENLEQAMREVMNDLRDWAGQLKAQGTGGRNENAERLMEIAGKLEKELNRGK